MSPSSRAPGVRVPESSSPPPMRSFLSPFELRPWERQGSLVGSCQDGLRGGRGALRLAGPLVRVGAVQLSRNRWPFESGCAHLYISIRSIKTRIISWMRKASFMRGLGEGRRKMPKRRWAKSGAGGTVNSPWLESRFVFLIIYRGRL